MAFVKVIKAKTTARRTYRKKATSKAPFSKGQVKAIAKIADKVDRKNDETKRVYPTGASGASAKTLKGNTFDMYDAAGTTSQGPFNYQITPINVSQGTAGTQRVGNEINWVGTQVKLYMNNPTCKFIKIYQIRFPKGFDLASPPTFSLSDIFSFSGSIDQTIVSSYKDQMKYFVEKVWTLRPNLNNNNLVLWEKWFPGKNKKIKFVDGVANSTTTAPSFLLFLTDADQSAGAFRASVVQYFKDA